MKNISILLGLCTASLVFGQVGINTTTPTSTLDIRGSVAAQYNSTTLTSYPMTDTDFHVAYNGTANSAFTLPASQAGAANFKGRLYTIKNNSAFTVTVTPNGTETINGTANTIVAPNQSVTLINTGLTGTAATWEIVGKASSGSVTASNGLTAVSNDIRLGGTLSGTTDINQAGFGLNLSDYSNTSSQSPLLTLRRARGTVALPTAVQAADRLGAISFTGYSSLFGTQASIIAQATEIFTAGGNGSALSFHTVPNGSLGMLERMRIDNTGYMGMGTTTPSARLNIVNEGGPDASDDIVIKTYGTTSPAFIGIKTKGTIAIPTNLANNDFMGAFYLGGRVGGTEQAVLSGITSYYKGATGAESDTEMRFLTSAAERMTINSAGNVGVGIIAPKTRLHINGTASATGLTTPNSSGMAITGNASNNPTVYWETANSFVNNVIAAQYDEYGNLSFYGKNNSGTANTTVDPILNLSTLSSKVGIGSFSYQSGLTVSNGNVIDPDKSVIEIRNIANTTAYPKIFFNSFNGSVGSETAIASGRVLGELTFGGYSGGGYPAMSRLRSTFLGGTNLSDLAFTTSGSATPQLYVASYGFVGVQTSAPVNRFTVNTTVATDPSFGLTFNDQSRFIMVPQINNNADYNAISRSGDTGMYFYSATGAPINGASPSTTRGLIIAPYQTGAVGARGIKILENGNVGIGTTTAPSTLTVVGTAEKTGGGSWSTPSDARVKKNVQNYSKGLKEILAIRPVTFQYNGKADYKADGKTYVGVIAQEIEKVLPSTVTINERGGIKDLRQYDGSELTYTLINAIKEQQAQIKELKDEVEKLKSRK